MTKHGTASSGLYVVPEPTITSYAAAIMVDYGMNLEAMVKAGKYDRVDSNITAEHFPVGEGKVDREPLLPLLVHFGRDMEDEDVTRELDKLGLRHGAIEELLAFGAKFPDLQCEFPIIGRQSVWQVRDRSLYPYLFRDGYERRLNLYLHGYRWHGHYRFLAFSK